MRTQHLLCSKCSLLVPAVCMHTCFQGHLAWTSDSDHAIFYKKLQSAFNKLPKPLGFYSASIVHGGLDRHESQTACPQFPMLLSLSFPGQNFNSYSGNSMPQWITKNFTAKPPTVALWAVAALVRTTFIRNEPLVALWCKINGFIIVQRYATKFSENFNIWILQRVTNKHAN